MQRLVDGIHHFQSVVFNSQRELFQSLSHGQTPLACFITCADSRINPNLITHTDPGELFIIRNAGNLVPPHGAGAEGEAAAVEFAVVGLDVRDIIVCGHTGCGAMQGLLDPQRLAEMPAMAEWLRHADATKRIMRENYGDLYGDALVTAAAQENVLVQLEHLRTLPSVAAATSRGELRLHGWMYKIETGEVFEYDPALRQFGPMTVQSALVAR